MPAYAARFLQIPTDFLFNSPPHEKLRVELMLYITKRTSVSRTRHESQQMLLQKSSRQKGEEHTKWVAARQLRLLGILGLKHITDAVEQLDIALLGVRLESRDESPGHGTRGLGCDSCIGTAEMNKSASRTCSQERKRKLTRSDHPCYHST